MSAAHFARRRVILAGALALAGPFVAAACGQAESPENKRADELRESVSRLARSHTLTENQSFLIRNALEELARSVKIFRAHGGLSPGTFDEKLNGLTETTGNEIARMLNAEQAAAWKHWQDAKPVPAAENPGRPPGCGHAMGAVVP